MTGKLKHREKENIYWPPTDKAKLQYNSEIQTTYH